MRDILRLPTDVAISCNTYNELKQLFLLLDGLGLTWRDGTSYLFRYTGFKKQIYPICIYPTGGTWSIIEDIINNEYNWGVIYKFSQLSRSVDGILLGRIKYKRHF